MSDHEHCVEMGYCWSVKGDCPAGAPSWSPPGRDAQMADAPVAWTANGWTVADLHAMFVELGDLFDADALSPKQLVDHIKSAMPPGMVGR